MAVQQASRCINCCKNLQLREDWRNRPLLCISKRMTTRHVEFSGMTLTERCSKETKSSFILSSVIDL